MVRTLKVAGHYACRNYDDLLEKGHTFLEGEKYKDDNHAWDDEMVGTEYREAQPRDNQSGNTTHAYKCHKSVPEIHILP